MRQCKDSAIDTHQQQAGSQREAVTRHQQTGSQRETVVSKSNTRTISELLFHTSRSTLQQHQHIIGEMQQHRREISQHDSDKGAQDGKDDGEEILNDRVPCLTTTDEVVRQEATDEVVRQEATVEVGPREFQQSIPLAPGK
jgi:hypothetical protein